MTTNSSSSSLCPYKGLRPYTEEDREYFFGRENDQEIIASNLYVAPLTILYGTSGVGKSSVLQAGVLPPLRKRRRVTVVYFNSWQSESFDLILKNEVLRAVSESTGQTPENVLQELSKVLTKKETVRSAESLPLDDLLLGCAEAFRHTILVIFDQFEEYFLYHPPTMGAGGFDAEFARAINRHESGVNFMLSMREEELSKLDRFRTRIPNLLTNLLRLENLNSEGAEVAIREPLKVYNQKYPEQRMEIEDALVFSIIEQVRPGHFTEAQSKMTESGARARSAAPEARIETPFLQLVLTRLWEAEKASASNVMRLDTFTQLGGARAIARHHLDTVMSKLDDAQRNIAASILRFLVTPTGSKIAQQPAALASWSDLKETDVQPVLTMLSRGQDMSIIRKVSVAGHPERYELFHDVLGPAILEWRSRYVQAQERAEAEKELVRQSAENAIAQMQLARERSMARRLRLAMVGMVVLMIMMTGVTVWAFRQRSAAKDAEATALMDRNNAVKQSELANEAKREAVAEKNNTVRALVVADVANAIADVAKEEAVRQRASAEESARSAEESARSAEESARQAEIAKGNVQGELDRRIAAEKFAEQQTTITIIRDSIEDAKSILHTNPEQSLSIAKNAVETFGDMRAQNALLREQPGLTLAANYAEDVLRQSLIALLDSNVKAMLQGHEDAVQQAVFSPDGNLVVTTGADNKMNLRDLRDSGRQQQVQLESAVKRVSFNRDGNLILTVGEGGEAVVWDANKLDAPLKKLKAQNAAFTPDGKSVVILNDYDTEQKWNVGAPEPVVLPLKGAFAVSRVGKLHTFSPDGKLVLTTRGTAANVWETETGNVRGKLTDMLSSMNSVAFSPDGKFVAVGSEGEVGVWRVSSESTEEESSEPKENPSPQEAATKEAQPSASPASEYEAEDQPAAASQPVENKPAANLAVPNRSTVQSLSFSPDGKQLLTLSADGTTLLWDWEDRVSVPVMRGQTEDVTNALFSPDGKFVVLLGADGTVKVWNIERSVVFAVLRGHGGPVLSAAFSADAKSLVTTSFDSTARVWEWKPETWRTTPTILPGHGTKVNMAAFIRNDELVVTEGNDGKVRLWNARAGQSPPLSTLPAHQAVVSPDGKYLVAGAYDILTQIFDTKTGAVRSGLAGHTEKVRSINFSSDGKFIVTASEDDTARVWDAETGATLAVLKVEEKDVLNATFSPDGKSVLTLEKDGTARVWAWQTEAGRSRPITLKVQRGFVSAEFSPDGKHILTVVRDRRIQLWNATTGEPLVTNWPLSLRSVTGRVVFSPDSRFVMWVNIQSVPHICEVPDAPSSGAERTPAKCFVLGSIGRSAQTAAFSPDSKFVVTSSSNQATIWELSTKRNVAVFRGSSLVSSVAFTPDGKHIITTSRNNKTRLWEVPAIGEKEQVVTANVELRGGENMGMPKFSSDGNLLFITSIDGRSVRAWDWKTESGRSKPLLSREAASAAISPDGLSVVTVKNVNVARVWEMSDPQRIVASLQGYTGMLLQADFSLDDKFILTVSSDDEHAPTKVNVWEAATGKLVSTPDVGTTMSGVIAAISPDGKTLVTAVQNEDTQATLWNAATGELKTVLKLTRGNVNAIKFSRDGRLILTINSDKTVQLWNREDGQSIALLRGHFGDVTSAEFSHDGRFVVTASMDKTARVWETTLGTSVAVLKGHTDSVRHASFSLDGKLVVTASEDNTARVWRASTGVSLVELVGHTDDVVRAVFSNDGKTILTASDDGTAQIYACQQCGSSQDLLDEAKEYAKKHPQP